MGTVATGAEALGLVPVATVLAAFVVAVWCVLTLRTVAGVVDGSLLHA